MDSAKHDDQEFPPTQWSMVIRAGAEDDSVRSLALEALCRAYWPAVYTFARKLGHSPADAEDLTQGFFSMMLARGDLGKPTAEQGKFRTFIRTAFRHFALDGLREQWAQKRGGRNGVVSMDPEVMESQFREVAGDEFSPERAFDRHFAISVLERAMDRVRESLEKGGKGKLFEILAPFLDAGGQAPDYAEVARQIGQSIETTRVTVSRFRQQYRLEVRRELRETLGPHADVDEELAYLLSLFN